MENTILNGRYKIIRPVGYGGMAVVYLAHDMLLDRSVAVKMLREQFRNDSTLLEQFRREAKSAARLVHPYIINIYDVVSDGDEQYIVMEYVDGITLKEYMREHQLSLNAVLEIGVRLAAALQHAHGKNIIHCDIKPQNILIDKNLNPKIADFGIAKMVSSQTMVYTSTVMGSVHYISPEQAAGGQVTASSDVYSLGVVLFEMLTGHVPFSGNNAVAVAMMHAERPVPPLSDFMQEVPEGLQEILDKALAKKPNVRYSDAGALRRDLLALKMQLFPFSSNDYEKELSINLPEEQENILSAEDNTTMIMRPVRSDARDNGEEYTTILGQEKNTSVGDDEMARRARKKRKFSFKNFNFNKFMIMLTAFVVAISLAANFFFGSGRNEVAVPNVLQMTVVEAQNLLEGKKFNVELEEAFGDNINPGTVMKQSPAAGEMRKEGSRVTLVISKGAELRDIPDVKTMTLSQATHILERMGFTVGDVTKKYISGVSFGSVLEQQPKANGKAPKGSKINLVVNEGDKAVPNLIGKKLSDAEKLLRDVDLETADVRYVQGASDKDTVISTNPIAGTMLGKGDKVILIVSDGKASKEDSVTIEFDVPHVKKFVDKDNRKDKDKDGKKKKEKSAEEKRKEEEWLNNGKNLRVQIYVIDARGSNIIYDGKKDAGETIKKKVKVIGTARTQIYVENKLIKEKYL